LRRAAQRAARISYQPAEDWSKSLVDPMQLLAAFPCLKLRNGYILRAYLYTADDNGNGVVWVMPSDTPFPEPAECERIPELLGDCPKPPGASADWMAYIEADGSAFSYLCASLLHRELAEFGARWHGCGWSTCHILCRDPWNSPKTRGLSSEMDRDRTKWNLLAPLPNDWQISVTQISDATVVTLHTFSGLGQQVIEQLRDTYRLSSYRPECSSVVLAEGPGGYVF
jgi:hypothetical protein